MTRALLPFAREEKKEKKEAKVEEPLTRCIFAE